MLAASAEAGSTEHVVETCPGGGTQGQAQGQLSRCNYITELLGSTVFRTNSCIVVPVNSIMHLQFSWVDCVSNHKYFVRNTRSPLDIDNLVTILRTEH